MLRSSSSLTTPHRSTSARNAGGCFREPIELPCIVCETDCNQMRPKTPAQIGFLAGYELGQPNVAAMLQLLTYHINVVAEWMRPPRAANRLVDSKPGETRKCLVMSEQQPATIQFAQRFVESSFEFAAHTLLREAMILSDFL